MMQYKNIIFNTIVLYCVWYISINSTVAIASTIPQAEDNLKYIQVEELFDAISIKFPNKINVGFDVCDTILFTVSGIQNYIDKNCNGNWDLCMKTEEFWEEYNGRALQYSLIIPEAVKLINFHQKRGDKIFFITARKKTSGEKLSETLQDKLNIRVTPNNIFFTDGTSKAEYIKNNEIKIFYGDADSDVLGAIQANAMPVRIQRSHINPYAQAPDYNIGQLGEIIIKK